MGQSELRSFFFRVTERPRTTLLIAVVMAAALAVPMVQLRRETGPDAFIPPDHPALAAKKRVEDLFGAREPLIVGILTDRPHGIFNPETLRLVRNLTDAVQSLPLVAPDALLSIATESGVYFEDNEPGFDRLLKDIPQDRTALEALEADILGYELYRGTLLAADGSAASIVIRSYDESSADELYRSLTDLLQSEAVRSWCVHGERLVASGEAAVRAHMGVSVSDDALRMNFVCPVVMALLIVLAFRTVRGTVLPLCVIGGSAAAALGLMAAADIPIYIVTNGIFVVIMAVGVADAIHLVGQYYEEQLQPRDRNRQRIIVDACMSLWYPVLITSLTDLAGFFALYLAGGMPPIRYFGLFTCIGVLAALVFSYTVVPAGLAMVPLRQSPAYAHRQPRSSATFGCLDVVGRVFGRLGVMVYRRRWRVIALALVILGVAGWGGSKIVVNDARILAFKEDHPIVRATRALNDRFDGTNQLNILITADAAGALATPEVLRKIDALEAFTETLPHVGGTHSPAGWVKRAHQKMNGEEASFYAIPDDPMEIRYYLDVLSDKRTSPMASLLSEVVDSTYTRANLIVRLKSSQFIHHRELIGALEDYIDREFTDGTLHVKLAGRAHLDFHWLSLVSTTHIRSVALSAGCVLFFTAAMLQSILAGLICTATVGAAVLVNYALMGLGGIPLGVGTSMFASIAIGAGVNFPIHLLHRLQSSPLHDAPPEALFADTMAFTGRSLFFTAFILAVGFGLLAVSELRTLVDFGLLIAASILTSFVVSVTLAPAVVAVARPRFIYGLHRSGKRR